MIIGLMSRVGWTAVVTLLANPFAFLQPAATITERDRQTLDTGRPIARTVAGRPREIGIVTAVKVRVEDDRLVAWYRDIASLKRSAYVPEIGRFSDPPWLTDLDGLTLDETDLNDLRRCRPGACGLKLSNDEIAQLGRDVPGPRSQWRLPEVQHAFRVLVLRRSQHYLGHGRNDGPAPPIFLSVNAPRLADYLATYRQASDNDVESFLYWSKERFRGKPVVSVWHVAIARGGGLGVPDPVIISRQVFATHYLNGAWSVAAIVSDDSATNYLVYVNHSELDLLHGLFGGFVRAAVQRELKEQAALLLQGIRDRLESGDPPPGPSTR